MKLCHPMTGLSVNSLLWPVRQGGSTGNVGGYGWTRNGGSRFHSGVDWLAQIGQPIYAAASGRVARYGWQDRLDPSRGFGVRIYLRHDGSIQSLYAHLLGFSDFILPNARIQAGQLIGFAGLTGNTKTNEGWHLAPHLHFGVRGAQGWQDPLSWLGSLPSSGV